MIIFMYFVNITPIITFGTLTQQATQGEIGTIESIVGASMCGIIWSLFAGQPLIIVSQTGPMLVFDTILYTMSTNLDLDFLTFRFLTGIVCCVLLLIIVFMRLSKYSAFKNFGSTTPILSFLEIFRIIFGKDFFRKSNSENLQK